MASAARLNDSLDESNSTLLMPKTSDIAPGKQILTPELMEELGGYDFPFENIAFEGGGNKGLATTGAIRVLEELGYWGKIRRFAGASAGAMVSALVCIGYSSHDIEKFLGDDFQKVFLDAKFGVLSLLPNMLRKYGWHPGNKINKWFGDKVKAKMGNADLTFAELYQKTGKELCITVTNMNSMDCVYCHVKTRPDMPIREAVRMSACIPGVFCPVKSQSGSNVDYYVDGGLLCNFPLHCYDGWYLSMGPKDTFLQKFHGVDNLSKLWEPKERFCTVNPKTIGVLLYANEEREVMKDDLMTRFDKQIKQPERQNFPDTKMARNRADHMRKYEENAKQHAMLTESMSRFISALNESDIDHSGTITQEEFLVAMGKENSEFTVEDKKRLFGENFGDAKKLFNELDIKKDGQLTFRELTTFAERQGLPMLEEFRGYNRLDINNLTTFFGTIMDSLLLNMKRIFVQASDVKRTLGIDTAYLDTLDFEMQQPDKDFLINQGKLGCIAFLRELIEESRMTRKE